MRSSIWNQGPESNCSAVPPGVLQHFALSNYALSSPQSKYWRSASPATPEQPAGDHPAPRGPIAGRHYLPRPPPDLGHFSCTPSGLPPRGSWAHCRHRIWRTWVLRVFTCLLLACLSLALGATIGINVDDATLERIVERYGEPARDRVQAWLDLMRSHGEEAELEKLRRVNDFFNRIRYANDEDHWGQKDYWATPLEFLSTDAGDCEDFSIAKYVTLRQLGVATEKMKMTFVTALELNQPHMVLAYYTTPDADPLILDSLVHEIRPGSRRADLLPVYSFNADGLWVSVARGQGLRVGSSQQVGLWRDLALRMKREQGR